MIFPNNFFVLLRYVAVFLGSYLAALVPTLSEGLWPTSHQFVAALGAGLLGMGLFHLPSPVKKQ